MKKILLTVLFLLSLTLIVKGQTQQFVVGYYSNREWLSLNDCDLSELTHLNIAFANPNENGNLVTYKHEELKGQIAEIRKRGIKVLLAVGGGGLNAQTQDRWAKLVQPGNVDNFIDSTITTLLEYGYDGIDLDLEHESFLRKLGSNYAPYVHKLSQKLKEHNLILSTALFGLYSYSVLTDDVLQLFDYINIMTYDATGPWNLNKPGQHSSILLAKEGINFWINKGIPRHKIILGLPFYGWDFDEIPDNSYRDVTYAHMVEKNEDYAYLDNVGKKYYNGIPTILTKTILSENQCGGVMIWHISCDTRDKYSLLNAIKKGQSEYRANIARGKSVTSTELERDDCPTHYATDGNPTTRWSGAPLNPAYLTIDLGKPTDISSMTIDWEDSYAKSYEIQVSEDNQSWTTLKSFSKQNLRVVSNHALQYISQLSAKARYLRLKMTEGTVVNNKIWCYSIWDIRVFGQEITMAEEAVETYSAELYDPKATSDRGLEVALTSSDSTIAKIVSNKVKMLKAGNVEIVASQNSSEYGSAVVRYQNLTIKKANQTIDFEAIPKSELKVGKNIELKATASSKLTVKFTSSNTNIAEVKTDDTLHFKAEGDVVITAIQDGDDRYNAATTTQTITIKDANTGIEEKIISPFFVYPNPAKTEISIQGIEDNTLVRLYSTKGELLMETKDKKINIRHLPSGVYLIVTKEWKQQLIKE